MSGISFWVFFDKLIALKNTYYFRGFNIFKSEVIKFLEKNNISKENWQHKILMAILDNDISITGNINLDDLDNFLLNSNIGKVIISYLKGLNEEFKNKYRVNETITEINETKIFNTYPITSELENNYDIHIILFMLMIKYAIIVSQLYSSKKFSNIELREDNKILKESQLVFTIIILSTKNTLKRILFLSPEDENNKSFNDTISLICYLYRSVTYYLLNELEKSLIDAEKAERICSNSICNILYNPFIRSKHNTKQEINQVINDAINTISDINKEYLKFIEIHLVLVSILKGDIYFLKSNYENAFDFYCKAMREIKKIEEYPHIARVISYEIFYAKTQKAKIFFEMGEFRNSLCWYFESIHDLLIISSPPQSIPVKITRKIELLCWWLKNYSLYDKRIDKVGLTFFLKQENLRPCEIKKILLEYNNPTINKFASDIFLQIGYILYILKIEQLTVNYCKGDCSFSEELHEKSGIGYPSIVYHWLFYANGLDGSNKLCPYYNALYHIRNKEFTGFQKTVEGKIFKKDIIAYDSLERDFSMLVLEKLSKLFCSSKEKNIESNILLELITNIDNFLTIPKEIFKNITIEKNTKIKENLLLVLRRWSSFSPHIPGTRIFKPKGGGYFLWWHGKGIVIDPGYDFLSNLYQQGFSLSDIDAIIITHAHSDHLNDFIPILDLAYEAYKYKKKIGIKIVRGIKVYLNSAVYAMFSSLKTALDLGKEESIEKMEPISPTGGIYPDEELNITIEGTPADHHQTMGLVSMGLRLVLLDPVSQKQSFIIGFTGDTNYFEKDTNPIKKNKSLYEYFNDCNILIAHIGNVQFRELFQEIDYISFTSDEINNYFKDFIINPNINRDILLLNKEDLNEKLKSFLYSLGCKLRDKKPPFLDLAFKKKDFEKVKKSFEIGNNELDKELKNLRQFYETNQENIQNDGKDYFRQNHLGINGIKETYSHFDGQIFIISEFHEEMRYYRNKIAYWLQDYYEKPKTKCLTGDVGLKIKLDIATMPEEQIAIQCERCALDNDRLKIFHSPDKIKEVCIKNEDSRIAYYCPEHDSKELKIEELSEDIKDEFSDTKSSGNDIRREFIEKTYYH